MPVDEQVRGRAVDQLKTLAGNRAEVLGRDALAHDATGNRNELAVQVLDTVGLDPFLDLAHLLFPAVRLDEPIDVAVGDIDTQRRVDCRHVYSPRVRLFACQPAVNPSPGPKTQLLPDVHYR